MVQHVEKDVDRKSDKSNDSNPISPHSHGSCMPFIIHLNCPPSFSVL